MSCQQSLAIATNFINANPTAPHFGPDHRPETRTWSQTMGDYQRKVVKVRTQGLVCVVIYTTNRQRCICTGLDRNYTSHHVEILCDEEAYERHKDAQFVASKLAWEEEMLTEFHTERHTLNLTEEEYEAMSREQRLEAWSSCCNASFLQERWEEEYEDRLGVPAKVSRVILTQARTYGAAEEILDQMQPEDVTYVMSMMAQGLPAQDALDLLHLEQELDQDDDYEYLAIM